MNLFHLFADAKKSIHLMNILDILTSHFILDVII